jgi:hypothetical protein
MSTLIRIAMAGVIAAAAGAALAQGPGVLMPRQLVTQFSCADARDLESSLGKVGPMSGDERRELEIVWAACAAGQHNQEHPDQPQIVLVAPSSSAPATQDKTLVSTVRLTDGEAIRDVCEKAGGAVAAGGAPVSCESFVHGAKASLVILAPVSVGGPAVTARVLALIGSGDPDNKLAYETGRVAKATRGSAAAGAQAAADQPMLQVASSGGATAGGVGTLGGNGALALHSTKCLLTMGFGNGCPNR